MTVDVDDLAWRAVSRPRTVLLTAPRSCPAGVQRAISIITDLVPRKKVYVRKQILNNENVIADLETRGAIFVDGLDEVPEGATVMFSAHGLSPSMRAEAAARRLDVLDATFPLVTESHALAAMAVESDLVLVLGPMNSANSMRLVELAHRHRRPAHLIENAAAIRPAWLTGVRTIGLTAGPSVPARQLDGVLALLAELGPLTVSEVEPVETLHFGQPVRR
ncbi:hypothetical protein AB5J62_10650 [Amycolatopsis sp. cg5]|uniref:hypothetical protein n=1 Tax=Amycolatopsis sp. cg5 TaxID=3238802 RepID=UPI003523B448